MRFRAMFRMQWAWLQSPLLILSAAALVAPTLGLSGLGEDRLVDGEALIDRGQVVGLLVAGLSLVIGAVVAQVLWSADERVGHVYARTLPMERRTFLRYRAAGGLLVLAVPSMAIAVGVGLAAARATIPPGLEAYPWWTAASALGVMTLSFASMFFYRYGLTRRARRIIAVGLGLTLAASYLESQLLPSNQQWVTKALRTALTGAYSPLGVVLGAWRVIDV